MEQLSQALLISDQNLDVRRLAEVFLKCSMIQPSPFHIIPRDLTPKVTLPFIGIYTLARLCQTQKRLV